MKDTSAFSRRHFIKVVAAGLALSQTLEARVNSRVSGVYIGLQTFSLRTLPQEGVIDALISAMTQLGLGECELFFQHAEPSSSEAPDIRKWRSTVTMDYFQNIRRKFDRAGLSIYSYNPRIGAFGGGAGRGPGGGAGGPAGAGGGQGQANAGAPVAPPQSPITDEEIDRYFLMAKALGAKTLSSGLQPALAMRVAPIAEKHKMVVGIGSTNPDIYTQVLPMSPYFKIDIDIGDFTHAGYDPLPFIQNNIQRITDVHLKDSKFKGPSVPFGEGDAHMKEVLQLLKKKKSQIRAHIDCTYPGTGNSVEEVKKCFDFVKACLA